MLLPLQKLMLLLVLLLLLPLSNVVVVVNIVCVAAFANVCVVVDVACVVVVTFAFSMTLVLANGEIALLILL